MSQQTPVKAKCLKLVPSNKVTAESVTGVYDSFKDIISEEAIDTIAIVAVGKNGTVYTGFSVEDSVFTTLGGIEALKMRINENCVESND